MTSPKVRVALEESIRAIARVLVMYPKTSRLPTLPRNTAFPEPKRAPQKWLIAGSARAGRCRAQA